MSTRGDFIDGKYAVVRPVGKGSAGDVFEAEHLLVGKRVAIKVLQADLAGDPEQRARFFAEARAAARIAHPHVVDIYDLGLKRDGSAYIVMELLEGETLEHIIEARGPIAPSYACELVLQMLSGLSAAHAEGIVHRDLKPANVIVTHPRPDRPHVKVLDFGIAQGLFEAGQGPDERGRLFGTPLYMAPEQINRPDVDQRADVYAAGVILYEMLAGQPPYLGTTADEVFDLAAIGGAPLVSELEPTVPEALARVVARAMCVDPSHRIASAAELGRELAPFVSSSRAIPSLVSASPAAPIPLVHTSPLAEDRIVIRDSNGTPVEPNPAGLPASFLIEAKIPKAPPAPRLSGFPSWGRPRVSDLPTPGLTPSLMALANPSVRPVSSAVAATILGFSIGVGLAWMGGLL